MLTTEQKVPDLLDEVFGVTVGFVGSGADGQERILEDSLVQKGDFIEAGGQNRMGRKSCPRTTGRDWLYTMELREVKVQGKFPVRFSYAKEDSQDSRSLAVVKGRLFSLQQSISIKTVGSSRRKVLLCQPQVFVNGLHVRRKFRSLPGFLRQTLGQDSGRQDDKVT